MVMTYKEWAVDELAAEVGRRFRAERLNRNLTQKDLADRAGVSETTLREFESGSGNPSLQVILKLLRGLDLLNRIDALFPEPGPSPVQAAQVRRQERQRASGRRTEKPAEDWEWH